MIGYGTVVCGCASEDCRLNGCQTQRQLASRNASLRYELGLPPRSASFPSAYSLPPDPLRSARERIIIELLAVGETDPEVVESKCAKFIQIIETGTIKPPAGGATAVRDHTTASDPDGDAIEPIISQATGG